MKKYFHIEIKYYVLSILDCSNFAGGGGILPTTAAHYIFNAIVWVSINVIGELAQMVERSLSMWEVPGSMPGFSSKCLYFVDCFSYC